MSYLAAASANEIDKAMGKRIEKCTETRAVFICRRGQSAALGFLKLRPADPLQRSLARVNRLAGWHDFGGAFRFDCENVPCRNERRSGSRCGGETLSTDRCSSLAPGDGPPRHPETPRESEATSASCAAGASQEQGRTTSTTRLEALKRLYWPCFVFPSANWSH